MARGGAARHETGGPDRIGALTSRGRLSPGGETRAPTTTPLPKGRHLEVCQLRRAGLAIPVFAGRLACFRIDQMQASAHKAGDALIEIAGPFGLIVRRQALHPETCVGAAVNEWRH